MIKTLGEHFSATGGPIGTAILVRLPKIVSRPGGGIGDGAVLGNIGGTNLSDSGDPMPKYEFSSPSERRDHALKLREGGMTYKAIGEELKISAGRARELCIRAAELRERNKVPILSLEELGPDSPVTNLPVSLRARRALLCSGFNLLGDIVAMDRDKFIPSHLLSPHGGRKTLNEILALVDGYAFRQPVD